MLAAVPRPKPPVKEGFGGLGRPRPESPPMKAFAAITACALGSSLISPVWAQQYTMKLSAPTVNDMNVEYMKAMKAGIEPRSNGRIKVEVYPANQLGQIPRTVEGVALGTIEMTLVASGFFIGIDPRYLVI